MKTLVDEGPNIEPDPVEVEFGYCQRVLRAGIWLMRHGYGRMMLLPYIAPSGCYWRCEFHPVGRPSMDVYRYTSGNMGQYLANHSGTRTRSNIAIKKLAQLIIGIAPSELMERCKGELEPAMESWLQELDRQMSNGCVPAAFDNWSTNDPNWWLLSHPSGNGAMMPAPPGYVQPGGDVSSDECRR